MGFIKNIQDRVSGKVPEGSHRSDKWPTVRKKFLEEWPVCSVCGGHEQLEVHHVKPFHLSPALELDSTNLITLCEAKTEGKNCHLLFGHLGNFKSFNIDVRTDVVTWRKKIFSRPGR